MSYARFRPMVEDARAHPAIWRLVLGVATVLAVQVAWMSGLVALAARRSGGLGEDTGLFPALPLSPPAEASLLILLVAGLGLGTLVAARLWQRRGLRSLTGRGSTLVRHFAIGAGLTFFVMIGLALALPISGGPVVENMEFDTWLRWLPVGIAVLLAQTGAEELFFRGYLQSQIAARFARPFVWMLVPSLLFGFSHYLPTYGPGPAMLYVLATGLFGLLAADLTARTGNLGAAWGFHFANNALAILIVGSQDSIAGLALYRTATDFGEQLVAGPSLALDALKLVAVWALLRRVLAP